LQNNIRTTIIKAVHGGNFEMKLQFFLQLEVEIFLRFSEIAVETKKRDVIQA